MNFCNFAKVLLAHSSKDKASVDWWENENKTKDDSAQKFISTILQCRQDWKTTENLLKIYQKCKLKPVTASIPFHEFKNISVTQNIGRTQTKVRKEGNF